MSHLSDRQAEHVLVDSHSKYAHGPFKDVQPRHPVFTLLKNCFLGIVCLLFPLRCLLVASILCFYYVYLRFFLALYGIGLISSRTREKAAGFGLVLICNLLLISCGVYKASRNYVTPQDASRILNRPVEDICPPTAGRPPYILVSNHVSVVDPCLVATELGFSSFVCKESLLKIPIFSLLMQQMHCLFVGKRTKGGVIPVIQKRLQAYYQREDFSLEARLVIYPEATTTNGEYMIVFHDGAFSCGAPVQPFVLKYSYKNFCPGWWGTDLPYFFGFFSQLYHTVHVVHFPPYHPSAEEKTNASLYASNVRRLMVEGSNMYLGAICGEMQDSPLKFVRDANVKKSQ